MASASASDDIIPSTPDKRNNPKSKTRRSLVKNSSVKTKEKGVNLGWEIKFPEESQNLNSTNQSSGYASRDEHPTDKRSFSNQTTQSLTPSPSSCYSSKDNTSGKKIQNEHISTPGKTTEEQSLPMLSMSPVAAPSVNVLVARLNELEERVRYFEEQKENRRRVEKVKVHVRKTTKDYVKVCTRNIINDQTNDLDWDLNIGVFTGSNDLTSTKIRENVKALDCTVTNVEVQEAIKTYFNSSKSYMARKSDKFLREAAKIGRKKTKLKNRKNALENSTTIPQVDKLVIETALTLDFMSSEDERDEDDLEHFEIRPLRWRTHKCDKYFESLDKRHRKKQSKRSRRLTVIRKMGPYSSRKSPELNDSNSWAIKNN